MRRVKQFLYLMAICLPVMFITSCSGDDEDEGGENSKNGYTKSELTGMKLFSSYSGIDSNGYPEHWETTLTFKTSSTGHYYYHISDYIYVGYYKKDNWTDEWDFIYTWNGKVLHITPSNPDKEYSMTLYYVNGNFCDSEDGSDPWTYK